MLNRPGRSSGAAAGRTLLWVSTALILALVAVGAVLHLRRDPAEGLWREAASLVASGHPAEARVIYETILRDHPESRFAPQASRILGLPAATPGGEIPPTHVGQTQKLYQEARNFYPLGSSTSSDLEEAAWRYRLLADSWPADPLARESLFQAAQCYDHLGRIDEAIACWELFLGRYPDDGRASEVLYALAYSLQTQRGDPEQAAARFQELERRYPESNAAAAARALRGGQDAAEGASTTAPGTPGRPSVRTEPGRL